MSQFFETPDPDTIPARVVLDTPMSPSHNDAHATNVRGYLAKLLDDLWREEEGFDGKRPFGNSGWKHEVHQALFEAGHIGGEGPDDDLDFDRDAGEVLIHKAIEAFGKGEA